jgi:hypothetical protein
MAGNCAGCLILGELRDAPGVALLARKCRRDEDIDEVLRFVNRVLTCANRDHVRIVVFASKLRGCLTPDERRACTLHLVCSDLFAVTRTTEDDGERLDASELIDNDTTRRVDTKRRIVVKGLVGLRSVVDDVVAVTSEVLLQVFAELKPSVISSDVNPHNFLSVGVVGDDPTGVGASEVVIESNGLLRAIKTNEGL